MTPDLLVFPVMSGSARQCGIAAIGIGEATVTLTRLKLNDQVPNDAWLGDPVLARSWSFAEWPARDPDPAGGGRP